MKKTEEQSKEQSGVVAGSSGRGIKDWRLSFKKLILGLVIVALAAVAILVIVQISNKKSADTKDTAAVQEVCDGDVLVRASAALGSPGASSLQNTSPQIQLSPDVASLQKITEEIKNKQNYEKDPRCLYYVTKYYVLTGDVDNAEKSLAQSQALVGGQVKSSGSSQVDATMADTAAGSAATQNESLKKEVDYLKLHAKQFETFYGSDYQNSEDYKTQGTNGAAQ